MSSKASAEIESINQFGAEYANYVNENFITDNERRKFDYGLRHETNARSNRCEKKNW